MERNHIPGALPLAGCRHGLEQSLPVGADAVTDLDNVVGNAVTGNAHGRGRATGIARAGHILLRQLFNGSLLCQRLLIAEGNMVQHPDAAFPHILQLCVRAGYVALQGAVLADGNIPLPGAIGNINPVVPAVDNVAVARTAVGSAAGQDDINGGKTGICLSQEAADRIALRDLMCGNRLGRVSGDKRFAVGFYDALADDIAVIQRPLCEVVALIQIPLAASSRAAGRSRPRWQTSFPAFG